MWTRFTVTTLSLQKQVRIQLSDLHTYVPEQVCDMRPSPLCMGLLPNLLLVLIECSLKSKMGLSGYRRLTTPTQ